MLSVTSAALRYERGVLRYGLFSQSTGSGKNTRSDNFRVVLHLFGWCLYKIFQKQSWISECYFSNISEKHKGLINDVERWVMQKGFALAVTSTSALRKLHDRLLLEGILWTGQSLCFPRGLFLILADPPRPAFVHAYSPFVISFVGQCNQMKGKYSRQTTVIVSGHCIEPSNMHLNKEQFLCCLGHSGNCVIHLWLAACFFLLK